MPVSIYEVAEEAKVSIATVSRVLSGRQSAQVAPATEARVRAAAQRLEYYPSGVARGLARGCMSTIGVVLYYEGNSVTNDPYLGPCLDGILSVHKHHHQNTVLFTKSSWAEALEHLPSYCNGFCDGLLVMLPRTDSTLVEALSDRDIPFVLIGDSRDNPGLLCVDVDNEGGGRTATRHLIDLGHRRIAAFCGEPIFFSSQQRLAGYKQALMEAGIAYDPGLVFASSYFDSSCGFENMHTILRRPCGERPSAVFCANDTIALGALAALQERGVSVPEEMSLIGFDDAPIAQASTPQLTTMRQPIRTLGECAAELLLAMIAKGSTVQQSALLPAALIVRASTAPPPPNRL